MKMKMAFAFILITIISGCFSRNKENKNFPAFDFLTMDSVTHYYSRQIPKDKPFVLIYFSPDCTECQDETENIISHMDVLKGVNFYFLTNDPFDRLKVFNSHYKMYKYTNVTLGSDYQYAFLKNFKPKGIPCSIVYDREMQVRALFNGKINIQKFIEIINGIN